MPFSFYSVHFGKATFNSDQFIVVNGFNKAHFHIMDKVGLLFSGDRTELNSFHKVLHSRAPSKSYTDSWHYLMTINIAFVAIDSFSKRKNHCFYLLRKGCSGIFLTDIRFYFVM